MHERTNRLPYVIYWKTSTVRLTLTASAEPPRSAQL